MKRKQLNEKQRTHTKHVNSNNKTFFQKRQPVD